MNIVFRKDLDSVTRLLAACTRNCSASRRCSFLSARASASTSVRAVCGLLVLDNAVKYSPSGSTIRLILSAGGNSFNQTGFVQLAIEDDGAGIPEDKAFRVFDRFFRVDEACTRDAGGAGLGLAIAKWAIEAHGGTITLSPWPTRGSIFFIRMPAA